MTRQPTHVAPGATMTDPSPLSDADRIIAAHRTEAHKTRVLLAWIFIGIPLLGGLIWGIVALGGSAGRGSSGTSTDTTGNYCGSSCPLAGQPLDQNSPCLDYTDAEAVSVPPGKTNPAVAFNIENNVPDVLALQTDCAFHPDSTLGDALQRVEAKLATH